MSAFSDEDWAEMEADAAQWHQEQLQDPAVMEEFSVIAERFPCLRGAPGVRPFDIRALVGWGLDVERQYKRNDSPSLAEVRAVNAILSAILLLCRLAGHRDERPVLGESQLNESHANFDVYAALSWWDEGDRAAFAAWALEGGLPLDRSQRDNLHRERATRGPRPN